MLMLPLPENKELGAACIYFTSIVFNSTTLEVFLDSFILPKRESRIL
jgi:hypothetical protein